jgi:hypothetical protein
MARKQVSGKAKFGAYSSKMTKSEFVDSAKGARLSGQAKAARLVEAKFSDPRKRSEVVKKATSSVPAKKPVDFVRSIRG